jgi:hypothetical protein
MVRGRPPLPLEIKRLRGRTPTTDSGGRKIGPIGNLPVIQLKPKPAAQVVYVVEPDEHEYECENCGEGWALVLLADRTWHEVHPSTNTINCPEEAS